MRFSKQICLFLVLLAFDFGFSYRVFQNRHFNHRSRNFRQRSGGIRRYDGDKVFRVIPGDEEQVDFLSQFSQAPSDQVDFWRPPSQPGQPVDVHVSAKWLTTFQGLLNSTDIPHHLIVDNVQRLVDHENRENRRATRARSSSFDIVGTFPKIDQLYDWLNLMCEKYPSIARCESIGFSHEGQRLNTIKIGNKRPGTLGRRIIFIEGTIHAREWLVTATIVSIINKMLTQYEKDPTVSALVDSYDWIFVPVANPDGYEFSHKNDRMWRKNRRVNPKAGYCIGVDLNRNWKFYWGKAGTSTDPCAETYGGTGAFSELETSYLSTFLESKQRNLLAYFSIHSYMPAWLLPYGYGPKPADYAELLRVAKFGEAALAQVNKKHWKIASIADTVGQVSGSSIDWAKAALGTPYSYGFELRPGSAGGIGFLALPQDIEPSAREVWAGLVAAVQAMKTYY